MNETQFKPISKGAWFVWAITASIPAFSVGAPLVGVAFIVDPLLGSVAMVLLGAVLAICWLATHRRWRSWGYAEFERDLHIKRGVLVRRLTVVPYGRMQFVDVRQGPLERAFGLSSVKLHTAAAATDASISYLHSAEAERLRVRLTELGEAHAAGI